MLSGAVVAAVGVAIDLGDPLPQLLGIVALEAVPGIASGALIDLCHGPPQACRTTVARR
jgi:hypothetical protein